jgi:hypothetical protein
MATEANSLGPSGQSTRSTRRRSLPTVSDRDEEPPRLLWRSIVQGFGFALGASLAGLLLSGAVLAFLAALGSSLLQHRP